MTIGATVLAITTSTSAGYIYSRQGGRFLDASVLFLVIVRLIPPIVVTLPLFPIINAMGLDDTHVVLIVLYATFFVSLGTVLMRTFIDQIPRELDEAAQIDGASRMTTLRKIIVPLAAPGILAVAVFVVVFAWNEFLFAFIFHVNKGKDGTARNLGDDRFDRWCRLGCPVCRIDHPAHTCLAVRRPDEPLPRGRPSSS